MLSEGAKRRHEKPLTRSWQMVSSQPYHPDAFNIFLQGDFECEGVEYKKKQML